VNVVTCLSGSIELIFSTMLFSNIINMTVFRDFAEFNIGMNVPPPVMNMNREPVTNKNRGEFEARNAILKRKQENERRVERYQWNFSWVALFCSYMHV